jgi:hypothetical protein
MSTMVDKISGKRKHDIKTLFSEIDKVNVLIDRVKRLKQSQVVDYGKVIRVGFEGIIAEAREKLGEFVVD